MRLPFFIDIAPADAALDEADTAADRAKHGIDLGQDEKSFPIASVSDLKKAIHAFGRAKPGDRAKVKRHIVNMAKKLGASDLIPDEWKESATFDEDGDPIDEAKDRLGHGSEKGTRHGEAFRSASRAEQVAHLDADHGQGDSAKMYHEQHELDSFHLGLHSVMDRGKVKRRKESAVPEVHDIDASEAATHTKMGGKQLRQHLVDAHYVDPDLASDASDESMSKYHGKCHGATNTTEPFTASNREEIEIAGDIIPLAEKAMAADDTVLVKLIQPGWGSSGYYPKSVLERDGPKVFPKGTMNFWDHPSASEEKDRPERSLRDLAATQVEDARFLEKGPEGPGLYARSKVFGTYKPALEELAPYIGASIRAMGRGEKGTAEGRDGTIINELVAARSVDFVTQAGAGGKIVALFESAGSRSNKEGDVSEGKDEKPDKATDLALKEATSRAERAETALLLREAKDIAVSEVGKISLPDVVKERIVREASANPPIKDGKLDDDAFKKQITEAVKTEAEYLTKVTGAGRVRGMGPSTLDATEQKLVETASATLTDVFKDLGLNESAAKAAAAGRN